ncbi:MAG: 50S ribosomal protein L22 [Schleiferiaceae bacterium]|jgi:large subunit ribosomal protein L22|nr:50S ribosomal protein L22 [Flavobacteriales bacterium]MDA9256001.1 50S ribosomal protein L22 [Schleiferiaceae bacterium]MDG1005634.1 50S ribosomal protein L22 [Schleiferiaceae bacterium]MDG1758113.1 50S ribosomal protein L22 [Schleiferiaceae bacterium]MDO7566738.1 50S ribosomal protein L22 [Schleiferiaceae bacterium]
MGSRKKNRSEAIKAAKKKVAMVHLRNCPTSPRKMRLMADLIRGMEVTKALYVLKHSSKEASGRLETLLLSALNVWETKNEESTVEGTTLVVSKIEVASARMLKRIRPAPQGRAHRIRKRSNHVTMIVSADQSVDITSSNEVNDAK